MIHVAKKSEIICIYANLKTCSRHRTPSLPRLHNSQKLKNILYQAWHQGKHADDILIKISCVRKHVFFLLHFRSKLSLLCFLLLLLKPASKANNAIRVLWLFMLIYFFAFPVDIDDAPMEEQPTKFVHFGRSQTKKVCSNMTAWQNIFKSFD